MNKNRLLPQCETVCLVHKSRCCCKRQSCCSSRSLAKYLVKAPSNKVLLFLYLSLFENQRERSLFDGQIPSTDIWYNDGRHWDSNHEVEVWLFSLLHSVEKSIKKSHTILLYSKCRILNVSIKAFSTNFCLIKSYLSGNTVWLQASDFQKLAKLTIFLAFLVNFCPLKM